MPIRRVCRIEIENFKRITEHAIDVAPRGAVFRGEEGCGKTSHLDALSVALTGRGLGVEAIRKGSDKASLLVKFDDGTTVKRSITAKGIGQPVVSHEGFKASSPQSLLNDMLGLAPFDVIGFFGAKPVERVRMLQEAVPCAVTVERLREWVPRLPDGYDVSGHGLQVVARLEKTAYDQRRDANAAAKVAGDEAARAELEALNLARVVDPKVTADEASCAHSRATRHRAELDAQVRAVGDYERRTAATREKIAALRDEAKGYVVKDAELAKTREAAQAANDRRQRADARIAELEAELAKVEAERKMAAAECHHEDGEIIRMERSRRTGADLESKACDLEESLATAAPARPTDDDIAEADRVIVSCASTLQEVERFATAEILRTNAKAKAKAANDAHVEAARLDKVVSDLRAAPRALLAESGGIEGIEIDGETIRLDGVAIDGLSSGEQLRFAVRVAKKLNKVPILIVDHLEHLAPKSRDAFVREATRDGHQLFATVVDDGPLAIEAIAFEDEAAAAE